MKFDLPEPPLALQTHSRTLRDCIAREIAESGPMKFSRFMQACLYTPGLGYYAAGLSKLGASGDFVTAPELGPRFGQMLARYFSDPLRALGPQADILELGPGTGALAEAVITALDAAGVPFRRYRLLEVSADLRQRQRQRLERFGDRVEWLEAPPPEDWQGVLVANEVIDALPVNLFARRGSVLSELRVGLHEAQLRWTDVTPDAATHALIETRLNDNPSAELPEQRGEVISALKPWLEAISATLTRGALVFVDYGGSRAELNHPSRSAGTLQCHYRHRAHFDPLVLLGLQDLTALVDFTHMVESAHALGLALDLYTTQAHFLIAHGIAETLNDGDGGALSPPAQLRAAQEIRRLTHPLEMGERFKVMVFSRDISLPDLSHIDRSNRL